MVSMPSESCDFAEPDAAGTLDFATEFLLFYSSNTFRTFGVAGSLGWHVDKYKTKGSFRFTAAAPNRLGKFLGTAELAL